MSYLTDKLAPAHNKGAFRCGKSLLDDYLHKQAKQDVKRMLAQCFIYADEGEQIMSYYTLSAASIKRELLTEDMVRKLPPSYSDLPVILLGRLAVSEAHQGRGIGELLLLDALKRCYQVSIEVGSMAVVVDPIDETAIAFYRKYDFALLPGSGKMVLPMATVSALFS